MIEIRNNMFQPLTFQLAGDAGSLHLGARQREIILDDCVSQEMRRAEERGFVSLHSVENSEESADEPTSNGTGTDQPLAESGSASQAAPSEEPQPRRRK